MDALAEALSELLALHAWEIIAPTVAALTPSENSLRGKRKVHRATAAVGANTRYHVAKAQKSSTAHLLKVALKRRRTQAEMAKPRQGQREAPALRVGLIISSSSSFLVVCHKH